jgi:predicted TIM-barrel fold metal-dependent hydrolase
MVVVDCQVHLWGPDAPERPWPAGAKNPGHRFLTPAALLGEMDAAGVQRAVLVPPAFEGDRNDVVAAAARRYPDRFGAMGRLALDLPQSREAIRTWRDTPGMLGIRQSFFTPEHRRVLASGAADWFWPAAEAARIPVYVFCPGLVHVMAEVARAHPRLRLVICHFGVAAQSDLQGLHTAVEQVLEAARFPNIAVTASALPCHAGEPYPFPSLRAPVRKVIDAFGASRVFWGSDLTRLPCTYDEVVAFGKQTDGLSSGELEQLMGAGLMRWLRWD